MLASRTMIDMRDRDAALATLKDVFARAWAAREEGLVLKAAQSRYNDRREGMRWVKLKKDYIKGEGDSHSFAVIAAGWDADRARTLRGACCF